MKLEATTQNYLDLNFELPSKGVSIVVFDEGIQRRTNEKTGKTTLQLPLVIEKAIEGDTENEGKKLSHFVPIETEWGGKQLASLLSMTGLINMFAEKFGNEVDVMDEKFINSLKLKLAGKRIKACHEVHKDQNGKDRTVITRFEAMSNGSPSPSPAKGKPAAAGKTKEPVSSASSDENW